jgi:hypothetical protein
MIRLRQSKLIPSTGQSFPIGCGNRRRATLHFYNDFNEISPINSIGLCLSER